jgi:hypothetical protein
MGVQKVFEAPGVEPVFSHNESLFHLRTLPVLDEFIPIGADEYGLTVF